MKTKLLLKAAFLAAVVGVMLVATAAATCVGVGTVSGDGLRLRAAGSIGANVLGSANKGDVVVILEEAKDGWYKVDCGTQEGYMSAGFVTVETTEEVELGYGIVTTSGNKLNLRADANTSADTLTQLSAGTAVKVIGVKDGWYHVTYKDFSGYVSSDYITLSSDEKGTRADGNNAVTKAAESSLGAKIVAEAKKHIGKPYRSGAKGPNAFDCSGFVQYVYKQFGISLSGGSSTQWRTAPGTRVYSISQLQVGDLFFICDPAYSAGYPTSHVAIYAGNNQIIHAASSGVGVVMNAIKDKDVRYFVGGIHIG